MKVLVTGASGLLGREILNEIRRSTDWDVIGIAFSRANSELRKVNICNDDEVRNIMQDFRPDVVVHAAAERRPDAVENETAFAAKLNVSATGTIARELNKIGGFLLYISSDYVFDGRSPPYLPGSQVNPLNKYGQLKLDGENICRENCASGILRIPVLYGPVEYLGESSVTSLLSLLLDSRGAKVCDYQLRYPTSTKDVAVVCRQIIERRATDSGFLGTWHWSGNEVMTKYDMVKEMARIFNLTYDHVEPTKEATSATNRPYDCHLDSSDLESLGIGQRTPFSEAIKDYLAKFVAQQS